MNGDKAVHGEKVLYGKKRCGVPWEMGLKVINRTNHDRKLQFDAQIDAVSNVPGETRAPGVK